MLEGGRQAWRNKYTDIGPAPPQRRYRQKRSRGRRDDNYFPVMIPASVSGCLSLDVLKSIFYISLIYR